MRFQVHRYDTVPTANGKLRGPPPTITVVDTDRLDDKGAADANGNCSVSPSSADKDGGHGLSGRETPSPSPSSLLDDDYLDPMARRGRLFATRQRRRLVSKDGECNVTNTNVSTRKRKYMIDLFTTLMDMKWRYNLLMFLLAFVCTWLIFAVLWWAICILHKDHLHRDDDEWQPCMTNVFDFTTALLFSIETQHTIGYGFRAMEPKCPEAVVLLMCQSCVGVFIQSLMTGLIFAKISRPKRRALTIVFSKNAVISMRDGEMYLLFRVGDMRKSHIVGTTILGMIVKNRLTKEGELLPFCQENLALETEAHLPDSYVFMGWPVTVQHKIDKSSPLWDISADQLLTEHMEIVVILEGTVASTGMTTYVRTSYLPSEIFWGHRLSPLLTYQKDNGHYKVDYSQFHNTMPVNMPECSAKTLSENGGVEHSEDPDLYENEYPLTFTAIHQSPQRRQPLLRTWYTRNKSRLTGLLVSNGRTPTLNGQAKLGEMGSASPKDTRKASDSEGLQEVTECIGLANQSEDSAL